MSVTIFVLHFAVCKTMACNDVEHRRHANSPSVWLTTVLDQSAGCHFGGPCYSGSRRAVLGAPPCLNSMAASGLYSAPRLVMEMPPGEQWRADWVEFADVRRHRHMFYHGFPQVTDIDNIIRHLTPQFPKCPPDVIAVVSCMLRNCGRFYH